MTAGPVDPRLLRYASASRWFLIAGAAVGFLQTLSIVFSAWFATALVVGMIDGRSVAELAPYLWAFGGAVVARATCVWLLDFLAARGAAQVISQLRVRVAGALTRLGPDWVAGRNSARITTVVAQGVDALDGYFSKYLPQLILTAVATPVVIAVLFSQDLTTGIIVVLTLPIIPIFMVLIGWATQAVQRRQWSALTSLASGFLDVVEGLATLTIFGRQHRQLARIERVTDDYRVRTMSVLRVSFISGFVLELAGSLSVALVAVAIGVRLVDGTLGLTVGLFVLLLTPEAYLPLRQVGAQFHAAADGVAAAEDVYEILDAARAPGATTAVVEAHVLDSRELSLESLTVSRGDRVIIDGLSMSFSPGRITAIAGPSGTGKSTVIAAVLGFIPMHGEVLFGGVALEPGAARAIISWAGQRPALMAGTVAENIALGFEAIDEFVLRESMRLAAAELIDPWLRLGVNGAGLSGGQAQRVSLARAFYRAIALNSPVIILDEPSSALDDATEGELLRGLRELATQGRAVIVVTHRPSVLAAADSIRELRPKVAVN